MKRVKNKGTHIHYLSLDIQNESIKLTAQNIKKKNVTALKKAKYYSAIFDCTPNVPHKEQISVVLRYIDYLNETGIIICEAFIWFPECASYNW